MKEKWPAYGLWDNKPQQSLEAQEEIDKIERLLGEERKFTFICNADVTYLCIDARA